MNLTDVPGSQAALYTKNGNVTETVQHRDIVTRSTYYKSHVAVSDWLE